MKVNAIYAYVCDVKRSVRLFELISQAMSTSPHFIFACDQFTVRNCGQAYFITNILVERQIAWCRLVICKYPTTISMRIRRIAPTMNKIWHIYSSVNRAIIAPGNSLLPGAKPFKETIMIDIHIEEIIHVIYFASGQPSSLHEFSNLSEPRTVLSLPRAWRHVFHTLAHKSEAKMPQPRIVLSLPRAGRLIVFTP